MKGNSMPRKNPIELENGRIFTTLTEATEFFRKILHSPKQRINKNDEEYSDLMALYKRHPEFESKSKSEENILYFSIKDSGEYNSKCFHSVHNDGSQTDWSFKTALTGKPKTKFQRFVDGARHSLEMETNRFRDDDFSAKCKHFLKERGYSVDDFPAGWVSESMNSQYRATLLGSVKGEFLDWYEKLL
jgi:hypothetical protein